MYSRKALLGLIALLAVTAVAFAFRIPRLEMRPMHTDESVHTAKAETLMQSGRYEYDPHEYHGPTIYYFALPLIRLMGAESLADTSEFTFRIVPVVFGTLLVLLLVFIVDGVGWGAVFAAALLTAVSPAMTYYSRYYIQEMLLVFFTFGTMAFLWRYIMTKRLAWAIMSGVCAGLMQATKETCVIAYASMFGAILALFLFAKVRDGYHINFKRAFRKRDLTAAIIVALFVSLPILSGFYSNPRGQIDAFLTYVNYLNRSGGPSIHDHPWYYYLKMLLLTRDAPKPWWTEAVIMGLALVGSVVALVRTSGPEPDIVTVRRVALGRFLVFYTVLMVVVYSLIPYKTPWCALSFLHGMILLAGIGIAALVRWIPTKTLKAAVIALFLLGTLHLAKQSYRANFIYYADTRNPYVYGHTSTDMLKLAKRVEDLAKLSPQGHDMLIRVYASHAWPMPWYFRHFKHIGFWQEPTDDVDAPVIITNDALEPEIRARLKGDYEVEYYGLRPEVLVTVFIRRDLWDAFIETRTGPKTETAGVK